MESSAASFTSDGLPPNLVHGTRNQIKLWVAFQFIDQLGLPILIATFIFCTSLNRHATLINACIIWVISGVIASLLFYTGHQFGPEPPKDLCIIQTSLMYAIPPVSAVTALALFFQVWSGVTDSKIGASRPRLRTWLLIASPYVVLIVVSIITAILAVQNPNLVSRHRRYFYCSLKYNKLTDTLSIFTTVVLLASNAFNVHIAIVVMRNFGKLRGSGKLQHLIRMLLLGLYIFFQIVLNVSSLWSSHSPAPDLIAASTGTVILLFFGSQTDVLREWKRILLRRPTNDDFDENFSAKFANFRGQHPLVRGNATVLDFRPNSAIPPTPPTKELHFV